MTRRLLIAATPGELRAAFVEAGRLVDFRLARTVGGSLVGHVFLGRVVRILPALGAGLIEIGHDRPAFLGASDALPRQGLVGLHEGAAVVVQVKRDARADKAAAVTMRVRLSGRWLDWVPDRPGVVADEIAVPSRKKATALVSDLLKPGEGARLRAVAAGAPREALAADVAALRSRWAAVSDKAARATPPSCLETVPALLDLLRTFVDDAVDEIIVDDAAVLAEARQWLSREQPDLAGRLAAHRDGAALFESAGVAEAVAGLFQLRVPLPDGGAVTIEPTAAATLIDVDTGALEEERSSGEAAVLAVNIAAGEAIARQIRLRGLAGALVVDFIALRKRELRDQLLEAFRAALAAEAPDAQLLGWTRLGNIELTRLRRRPSLHEIVFERTPEGGYVRSPLTVALDALAAVARQASAAPGQALSLRVHPAVAAALADAALPARHALETRLGRELAITAEPTRARDTFDIAAV